MCSMCYVSKKNVQLSSLLACIQLHKPRQTRNPSQNAFCLFDSYQQYSLYSLELFSLLKHSSNKKHLNKRATSSKLTEESNDFKSISGI